MRSPPGDTLVTSRPSGAAARPYRAPKDRPEGPRAGGRGFPGSVIVCFIILDRALAHGASPARALFVPLRNGTLTVDGGWTWEFGEATLA